MIVKGKDVIGLKVITVDTGSVAEDVDDIAYNPTTQRVEALLVSSGGIFSSAKAIHMDDVHNIGEHAVIVRDASVIKSVKDLTDSVRSISGSNKHLVRTNVLTTEGKELGRVTDIYFDSATGAVESMEVSQGGLKNIREGRKLINPSDIVTIGADATIVSTYTEAKFEAQAEEGGVNGAFNAVKDKAVAATETAKDKSLELKDSAQYAAERSQASIRNKSADLRDSSERKSTELRAKAEELTEDAKLKADQLATKARNERTKHVKSKNSRKGSATNPTSRKVVEQTTETVKDAKKGIVTQKTTTTVKK